jgi:hypothetical protein
MKYVVPIEFSSIPVVINYDSIDSAIAEYDPQKVDYALNDIVKVVADKKKYKLASAAVDPGTIPNQNPTIWQASSLSEYSMFNHKSSALSQGTDGIKFSFSGAGVDTVYFQDVDGDQIIVREKDSSGVVLQTQTIDIYNYNISSLGEYLFQKDNSKNKKIQVDIIEILSYTIEIEITGNASCRYFVAGQKDDLGWTLTDGIDYNIDDFFTQERDSWGDIIWGENRVIESANLPLIENNSLININVNKLHFLQGKPILWLADDRDIKVKEHEFINIFGRLINARIKPLKLTSTKTLQIEGM